MRKFVYENPEMEIITFKTQDVIEASGSGSGDSGVTEESEQPVLPWD
ncbi:MAG: hypothetical protein IJB84_04245 [Lachnospiraceae bacterium]|nr:hypothetical protein [Lachnospiraceae bacterium]